MVNQGASARANAQFLSTLRDAAACAPLNGAKQSIGKVVFPPTGKSTAVSRHRRLIALCAKVSDDILLNVIEQADQSVLFAFQRTCHRFYKIATKALYSRTIVLSTDKGFRSFVAGVAGTNGAASESASSRLIHKSALLPRCTAIKITGYPTPHNHHLSPYQHEDAQQLFSGVRSVHVAVKQLRTTVFASANYSLHFPDEYYILARWLRNLRLDELRVDGVPIPFELVSRRATLRREWYCRTAGFYAAAMAHQNQTFSFAGKRYRLERSGSDDVVDARPACILEIMPVPRGRSMAISAFGDLLVAVRRNEFSEVRAHGIGYYPIRTALHAALRDAGVSEAELLSWPGYVSDIRGDEKACQAAAARILRQWLLHNGVDCKKVQLSFLLVSEGRRMLDA